MLEKNKTLNSQHQIDVILAVVQAQNLDKVQAHALCAAATDKFVLAKVFSLSNKHALNVLVLVNKLLIHVLDVEDKAKSKLVKEFL